MTTTMILERFDEWTNDLVEVEVELEWDGEWVEVKKAMILYIHPWTGVEWNQPERWLPELTAQEEAQAQETFAEMVAEAKAEWEEEHGRGSW